MKIKKILQLGYYPVHHSLAGSGAQIIDGQWYMPRWGCDTLQHIRDEWEDSFQQDIAEIQALRLGE